MLRHGARLVVDEFDLDAYDARAVVWWLEHSGMDKDPHDMLAALQEHIVIRSRRIREELAPWFDLGEPVPGPYLYRWKIDPALRSEEEQLIAAGAIPAVGQALRGDPPLALGQAARARRPRACSPSSSAGRSRPRRRA